MAEQREIEKWITIKGIRIPIFKKSNNQDQNKEIAKKNEEIKQRQISENERQAQQAQRPQLPRRYSLDDIPAEVANRTTNVLNLGTKQRYRFKEGTKITEVTVFAGKGCSKEFRDAEKYAKRWGGNAKDWQHCSGTAQITNGVKTLVREVHWVQGEDGKMREAFIKYYSNQGGKQ